MCKVTMMRAHLQRLTAVRGKLWSALWRNPEILGVIGYKALIFNGSHLFAGESAAIVAPTGGSEEVVPFFFPADIFAGEVLSDLVPFVEDHIDGTLVFEWFCKAVFAWLIFFFCEFGLKGAEQLVPDDQEHAHVLIEVFGIAGMMDPVMGRGDEDIFEPAHFADEFGVYEDAPDLCSGIHEDYVEGFEAQEGERNEVYESVQGLEYGGAEAHGEVHVFGGVMRHVDGPEEADLMIPAVKPVVKEVFREKKEEPI